ncbi:N-terminal C2 in EEIG1 and EHBP1 proteins-domain-containing protein [Coniochaeta sp. 2T2.1]|nr:N-terminal C2 in EEIG1 and EHBP1 proteins-domain-containing protein [Coniochaeta sp. 2T2.1]
MNFLPLVNKARKPKFDVHLTIYDLNNVPLVTGVSFIKWHLPHSISSEHRGRTPKCPIANHRVEYNCGKVIPVRIGIDKNQNLVECPIEFEIVQEFSSSGPLSAGGAAGVVGGGTEKINLGVVRINLSEYVEESEALLRSSRRVSYTGSDLGRPLTAATSISGYTNISTATSGHSRKRSSLSLGGESLLAKSISSQQTSSTAGGDDGLKPLTTTSPADVEEGVIRRYLMQDSKINSTLKVGVLMVQIDGERNYVAPPLKTAPVFGGIAGLMASGEAAGSLEPPADMLSGPGSGDAVPDPVAGKPPDLYEQQDVYRRALAASWASQPGEMPADECIEDIFSGGDGFRDDSNPKKKHQASSKPRDDSPTTKGGKSTKSNRPNTSNGNGNGKSPASSGSNNDEDGDDLGTLRPHHLARLRQHFHRNNSNPSNPNAPTSSFSTTHTAFPAFKDPPPPNHSPAAATDPSSAYPHNNNAQVHFHSSHQRGHHRRDDSKEERERERPRSRSGSMGSSLGTALGTGSSEGSGGGGGRGREGFKKPREVREVEVREDMVAWTMGGLAI